MCACHGEGVVVMPKTADLCQLGNTLSDSPSGGAEHCLWALRIASEEGRPPPPGAAPHAGGERTCGRPETSCDQPGGQGRRPRRAGNGKVVENSYRPDDRSGQRNPGQRTAAFTPRPAGSVADGGAGGLDRQEDPGVRNGTPGVANSGRMRWSAKQWRDGAPPARQE